MWPQFSFQPTEHDKPWFLFTLQNLSFLLWATLAKAHINRALEREQKKGGQSQKFRRFDEHKTEECRQVRVRD